MRWYAYDANGMYVGTVRARTEEEAMAEARRQWPAEAVEVAR